MSLPSTLPSLTDREAITDALYRGITGIDTAEKPLFDSAFHPHATFDRDGKVSDGLEAIHSDVFNVLSKLDVTHFMSNIRVMIAADGKALLTASALSMHYRKGQGMVPGATRLMAGSLYHVRLSKEEGGESGLWKIEQLNLHQVWAEGDWGVFRVEMT